MTEDEARAWLQSHFDVPRETSALLERFVALLLDEAGRQNLIADSTKGHVWSRHIVDSAQLITLADEPNGRWIDLGSGAGLPGLVVAILRDAPMVLVESRRKRAEFLQETVEALGLSVRVTVEARRVESLPSGTAARVISARAFAPLDRLLEVANSLSRSGTVWVLPKGRSVQSELELISPTWQGVFHVEQSVTDPDSAIIVARNVRRGKP
jgi:16S rRNA (guanine527-N7)-methyltransferase